MSQNVYLYSCGILLGYTVFSFNFNLIIITRISYLRHKKYLLHLGTGTNNEVALWLISKRKFILRLILFKRCRMVFVLIPFWKLWIICIFQNRNSTYFHNIFNDLVDRICAIDLVYVGVSKSSQNESITK